MKVKLEKSFMVYCRMLLIGSSSFRCGCVRWGHICPQKGRTSLLICMLDLENVWLLDYTASTIPAVADFPLMGLFLSAFYSVYKLCLETKLRGNQISGKDSMVNLLITEARERNYLC